MRRGVTTPLLATILLCGAGPAVAQQPAPRIDTTIAERHDVINEKEHHYIGKVEFEVGDAKLYADDVWYYVDENRAVATGNVLFRQGTNQISADRAGHDHLLLRRDRREDWTQEIQDRLRRVHHMCSADAAMGPAGRHDRAQHRSLHAVETGRDERQGRAAVLSADPLLPHKKRGARDGVSAPDLRD